MNKNTRTATAWGLSVLAALGMAAGGVAAASATPFDATTAASAAVDDDVVDTLTYMREEERMARDLYAAIAELYDGARPFSMITNSEDHHFDAVGTLLDRYGVDDPSEGLTAGTYADDDLQARYDELLADAETSLSAAYGVGITVEETDIDDLDAALTANLPADVETVLEHLQEGSEHHLAAFTAAADGTGGAGPGAGTGARQGDGAQMGRGMGRDAANGRQGRIADGTTGDCPMQD